MGIEKLDTQPFIRLKPRGDKHVSKVHKLTLTGFNMHAAQREIAHSIEHDAFKYYVLNCSRQFGKTTLAEGTVLFWAFSRPNSVVTWFSASDRNNQRVYARLIKTLTRNKFNQQIDYFVESANAQFKVIRLTNGSVIQLVSVEKPEFIRGDSPDFAILDEFALFREDVYDAIIQPMFGVKMRKCLILSTPRGTLNHFYKFFQMGLEENRADYPMFRSWNYNYLDNPLYDLREIENAKRRLPDALFRQEYLAEFTGDGGSIFINVEDCVKANISANFNRSDRYYIGVDLGRTVDSTIVTVLNHRYEVVYLEEFKLSAKDSWSEVEARIARIVEKYGFPYTYIESNLGGSGGNVLCDGVKREVGVSHKHKIIPFRTKNDCKNYMVEKTMELFQDKKISIPNNKTLKEQLKLFTFIVNPQSRIWYYAAPQGLHDDYVISLCLAVQCMHDKGSLTGTKVEVRK